MIGTSMRQVGEYFLPKFRTTVSIVFGFVVAILCILTSGTQQLQSNSLDFHVLSSLSNSLSSDISIATSSDGRFDLKWFDSANDAKYRVERSFWRDVESNCGSILSQLQSKGRNKTISFSDWDVSQFTFPVNLRAFRSSDRVFVSFDVIGKSPSQFGNWWTVRVSTDNGYHRIFNPSGVGIRLSDKVIELVGRVVDHWNGNYTVYFQLPQAAVSDMSSSSRKLKVKPKPKARKSGYPFGYFLSNVAAAEPEQKQEVESVGYNPEIELEPVSNKKDIFTVDLLLDYMACTGYPDALNAKLRVGNRNMFQGKLALRAVITGAVRPAPPFDNRNVTQVMHVPLSPMSNVKLSSMMQYLCDVGYYEDGNWIMPMRQISSSSILKVLSFSKQPQSQHPYMLMIGDSTTSQLERCIYLKKQDCQNPKQCQAVSSYLTACEQHAKLSNYSDGWAHLVKGERDRLSPNNLIPFMTNSHINSIDEVLDKAIYKLESKSSDLWKRATPEVVASTNTSHVVFVANIGLHEMVKRTWELQKQDLAKIIDSMARFASAGVIHGQRWRNRYDFVWRGTWSIHEYCFHKNEYWFPPSYVYPKAHRSNTSSTWHLRDAVSYLQWSYTYDRYMNLTMGTSKAKAIDIQDTTVISHQWEFAKTFLFEEYWYSKARMKRQQSIDMRHHDIDVVGAAVEKVLRALKVSTIKIES